MNTDLNNPCKFCEILEKGTREIIHESEYFFVIQDSFPVNKGHSLVIPKRHQSDLFSLDKTEWIDLQESILAVKILLDKEFQPAGYNLGVNCGASAGQTIFHLHIHIIPRYPGDVENPRGGIRNFKDPLVKY